VVAAGFADEPPASLSRTMGSRSAARGRASLGLSGRGHAGAGATGAQDEGDGLPSVSLLDGINASFLNDSSHAASAASSNSSMAAGLAASVAGAPGDQCWVTMFGFPASQTAQVIEEMLSCGQIVSHHSDGPLCNWVHVQFETPLGAQRALTRDGAVLERVGLMVGVRRASGPASRPRVAHAVAAPQSLFLQARNSHSVTASGLAYEFAPYALNTWWSRVKYYFFGV
jgi:hypothetical protein